MIQLSKEKMAVLKDAEAAGYTVQHREGCVKVFRKSKHAKPRLTQGVTIFADGIALDMTVDLTIAKAIRSAAGIRSTLGL